MADRKVTVNLNGAELPQPVSAVTASTVHGLSGSVLVAAAIAFSGWYIGNAISSLPAPQVTVPPANLTVPPPQVRIDSEIVPMPVYITLPAPLTPPLGPWEGRFIQPVVTPES